MEINYILLIYKNNQLISQLALKDSIKVGTDPRSDIIINDEAFLLDQFEFKLNNGEIILTNLENRFNPNLAPKLNQKLMSNHARYFLTLSDEISLGQTCIVISNRDLALKINLKNFNLANETKKTKSTPWNRIKNLFKT